MKQLFLMATVALAAAGCANELRPIHFGNAQSADGSCGPQSGPSITAGSLDLAPLALGAPVGYPLFFNLTSRLEAVSVSVSEGQVATPTRNDFIAEEMELTLTSQPAGNYPTEVRPLYFVVPAGGDAVLGLSLLSGRTLVTALGQVNATGAPVQLTVGVRLMGKLGSGQSAESNEASFPVTLYNSGLVCPPGTSLETDGPCGGVGGYNGVPLSCEEAAP